MNNEQIDAQRAAAVAAYQKQYTGFSEPGFLQFFKGWLASATASEGRIAELTAKIAALEALVAKRDKFAFIMGQTLHNVMVGNQAAWIEWQHGSGAEQAMTWIHNGLVGPGLIPAGREAQQWFDENVDDRYEIPESKSSAALAGAIAPDEIEQARREGWAEGMQEAANAIADDDSSHVLANLESALADLLPGSYYMDPPDGGSVTLIEQVRRMAEDAKAHRELVAALPKTTHQERMAIIHGFNDPKLIEDVRAGRISIHAAVAGSATPSTTGNSEAAKRIRAYLERRKKARQIGYESIHSFDLGPNEGFELLASDIEALLAAPVPQDTLKNADSERLDFVLDRQAFILTIPKSESGLTPMYQLMEQDEDEDFHAISGDGVAYHSKREAIDAACTAAIESDRATITKEAE